MKRRRVVVGLVLLALAGVLAVALWPHGPRPCRETFEQVREGMTYAEVCATVGGPPGAYTDGPKSVPYFDQTYGTYELWLAADGTLRVYFDRTERAYCVDILGPPPDTRSHLQRLLDRLGL